MIPRPGDVLRIGRSASIQFAAQPFNFRVIRMNDWTTYDGWAWLDGYQLDAAGDATARRQIFVMLNGIRQVERAATIPRRAGSVAGQRVPATRTRVG